MIAPAVRYVPCGDAALAVQFDAAPCASLSLRIAALHAALKSSSPAGAIECVSGLTSLTIFFDPEAACPDLIEQHVAQSLANMHELRLSARRWRLPVCYARDLAPDLEDVAERSGLSVADVIEAHTARPYAVYLIGFSPGFPYMGEIDPRLTLPRRAEPRVRVPAGSVAIATCWTAIYPQATAGGWHIIGATPALLFDVGRESPALLAPGDVVRFAPIARDDFDLLKREYSRGLTLAPDD